MIFVQVEGAMLLKVLGVIAIIVFLV